MSNWNISQIFLIGVFISLNVKADKKSHVNFPRVTQVRGHVTNQGKPVTKDQILTERAAFSTPREGRIEIALDAFSRLIIEEMATVDIPVITWGEGRVSEINLQKGRVFYSCEKNCARVLSTPLNYDSFGNGEFWLKYQPESPNVELLVLHGEQEFGGLGNEATVKVSAGKKVVFQGLKEDGEISYDQLLKGKRAARGQLTPISEISSAELKELTHQSEKKKVVFKPVGTPKPPEKAICQKPYGEFNQCHWTSKTSNGLCSRLRCDANGVWSDEKKVSNCGESERIENCDY